MQRYSLGPEYKGWQQQSFVTGGPLDFEVDLSRDEVGPQKKPGEYRRVWILEFGGIQGKVSTQRQLGMNYRVTNEDKEAESSEFLRR